MNTTRTLTPLLAAAAATVLLAGCGSDAATRSGSSDSPKLGAATQADSGSGAKVSAACDVTTQATVASVFPGAGPGKAGQVRNCEYSFGSGALSQINVYYFADTTLAQYKQGAESNGVKETSVNVGDAAIRDQLHSITVQKGDLLFGVQALPKQLSTLANYDSQTLALAKKIAAQH